MCFKGSNYRNAWSGFEIPGKDRQTIESTLLHLRVYTVQLHCLCLFIYFLLFLSVSDLLPYYLFLSLLIFLPSFLVSFSSATVFLFFIFRFLPFLLSPFIQFHDVRFYVGSGPSIHAEFLIQVTHFSPWILLESFAHLGASSQHTAIN
jgi:hypothetical protein